MDCKTLKEFYGLRELVITKGDEGGYIMADEKVSFEAKPVHVLLILQEQATFFSQLT